MAEIAITPADFVVEIRIPLGDLYAGRARHACLMGIAYGAMIRAFDLIDDGEEIRWTALDEELSVAGLLGLPDWQDLP